MNENASLVRRYRNYELEEEKTENGIRKEIFAEGKEIGLTEGAQQAKQEMVLAMYDNNEPLDKIQKYSGLSQEEVETIINNSNKNK